MDTQYVVTEDTHEEMQREAGDEPYEGIVWGGGGETVTLVTGDLADRVLARVGGGSKVEIVERYELTGYCYTCAGEDKYFDIRVDGETVFTPNRYDVWGIDTPQELSGYGLLQEWLDGAA